jgi:hypothetical protein
MMAETYLLQAIQAGIAQIQQTPSLLTDILDALSAEEQTSAQNYFTTAKIKVAPGFPQEQMDMPFIGVTVAAMQQNARITPIGFASQTIDNGDGTSTVVAGFGVDGVIKATIYTPNADLIVWLSEVVFWCLGTQAQIFFDAGFGALQLGLGDYEPSPDFLPVFTFARGVTLSGKWLKSFAAPPVNNVTATSLILNDTE